MHRWERRLADLGHLLATCSTTYFDPDLFRLNTNQFLTTARTVTFLIQKEKEAIPGFQSWYQEHVTGAWAGDPVMTWAKDSRNHIEKEGDLDLSSELAVTLIFSYDETQDITVKCERTEVLRAGLLRLMRFAEKWLPTGVADGAVLRIQRRWVANSLQTHELLQALAYVYERLRVAAASLAKHLGHELPSAIRPLGAISGLRVQERYARYVKFNARKLVSVSSRPVEPVPNYTPPPWLADIASKRDSAGVSGDLPSLMAFHADMAAGNFQQFGNHLAMLWMYNDVGEVIDYTGVLPDDQGTKYIFWRTVADRVSLLRPAVLIWVSETWLRGRADDYETPIHKLPLKGEQLHVVGLDKSDNLEVVAWDIVRQGEDAKPSLANRELTRVAAPPEHMPYFFLPARRALRRLYGAIPMSPKPGAEA